MGSVTLNNGSGVTCMTPEEIKLISGSIVENSDGTVSVYTPSGPIQLTSECCSKLNPLYSFDINKQECRWNNETNLVSCNSSPFLITLNPKGNDGSLFNILNGETCSLNIEFDYVIKLSCENLAPILTGSDPIGGDGGVGSGPIIGSGSDTGNLGGDGGVGSGPIIGSGSDTGNLGSDGGVGSGPIIGSGSDTGNLGVDGNNLGGSETGGVTTNVRIINQQAICDNIANEIATLQNEIINTSYSIVCERTTQTSYVIDLSGDKASNFGKTGFGIAPFSYVGKTYADPEFTLSGQPITYCLSEPEGLRVWSTILGTRYNRFLDGDQTSYTCADVDAIVAANNEKNSPTLITECSTPFGRKTELIKQLGVLLEQQADCSTTLTSLESKFAIENNNLRGTSKINCNNPIEILESLDISLVLEIVSGTSLVTISEFPLFPYTDIFGSIGVGNLYDYLTVHTPSGFYVCGDLNGECMPLTFDSIINPNSLIANADSCTKIISGLIHDLYVESGLPDAVIYNAFISSLPANIFSSSWLHYNNLITDENLINAINGQKIKFSIKVNSTCGNFCVLIDDIKLNKTCTVVKDNNIFVSQSPGFKLERINDNKKSWINNTTPINRPFDIRTNIDTNIIRETNYDVNDERLVINTKEIDLDVSIASAIEQDVFCYIQDNSCLLDCSTGTTNVTVETDVDFSGMLLTQLTQMYLANTGITSASTASIVWGVSVISECKNIYTNTSFYSYSGLTTEIDSSPTQAQYIEELNNIAIALGLDFTSASTSVIFTDIVDCNVIRFFGDNFIIDISLDITSCYLPVGEVVQVCYSSNTITTVFDDKFEGCGDLGVNLQALLTTEISDIFTVDDFTNTLLSELINAKNRQTISGYPTLRALYDRYLNSSKYCSTNSSAFNYITMDQFAGLLGNYWVDLVEQVVPATTIWGSVRIYSNTVFDQQKYQYKTGTLFTCLENKNPCNVDTMNEFNTCIGNIINNFYI